MNTSDFQGWSGRQSARRGGHVCDNSIYGHPIVLSDDERLRAWCINPECGKRLNNVNAKRLCLCHQCEGKWQHGLLVLLANADKIVGVPAPGAIATFDHIDLVKSLSKRGTVITRSLQ
jgi:hypothetical protein